MTSVVVAMSGGVDSSVAALLLARDGRALAGMTLRLSDQESPSADKGRCCAVRDVSDARRVAALAGLPHYVLDMREQFARAVIDPFVDEYLAGRTPVPCVACNDAVKFDDLLRRARTLGAERVATGHYARIARGADSRMRLLRAADRERDQSYFLHGLTQAQLAAAEFPLGEMTKQDVRRLAREAGLAVADKPDSREICFVPDGDAAAFVERRAKARGTGVRPGALVDEDGRERGTHGGVHRFTVGQRRGLGAHGEVLHVIELRADTAEVVVSSAAGLLSRQAVVPRFRWVAGEPPDGRRRAQVQVRHGLATFEALLTPLPDGATRAEFTEPVRAVAPGQYLVAYCGDECLGGGAIGSTEPA